METIDLKTNKYKTATMVDESPTQPKESDMDILDRFLEDEKITNLNGPWCKLDKTIKLKKLLIFVEKYKEENHLQKEEELNLIAFFKDGLNKKKFNRVKDVIYDKTTGEVKSIPLLMYNTISKNFTLKTSDKRVSTLKGLPPKKIHGTLKNKHNISV
jgi:hypothetical protein